MVMGLIALIICVVSALIWPDVKITSTTGATVFLYSVGLLVGIKRFANKISFNILWTKVLAMIAGTNLGVYLVHPFFIKLFDKLFSINENDWFHIYIFPFLIYAVCIVFTLVCKKIPIIKNIFP
nr:hypothetical protein [Paucilactobacillus kaifaensis]